MEESRKNLLLSRLRKTAAPKPGAITTLLAKITGAPVKGVGEGVSRIFAGGKAYGGVHKGKRLQYVGRQNISAHEAAKLRAMAKQKGGLPGQVEGIPQIHKIKGPAGQTTYQKDQYRPGGMVGFAMKHPVISGIGGYVGYKALTAPRYPSPAGAQAPAPAALQPAVNPNPWG